jgi:hypothetical protein
VPTQNERKENGMEIISRDALEIEALRAGLKGAAYIPGGEGYDGGRAAWNLNADQYPALVVMAEDAADIVAAVRYARERDLGVGGWRPATAPPLSPTGAS